jgi:plasmid stabilization system protein ParE
MKVIWTPGAQQCLRKLHDYIAQDQPLTTARWIGRVLDRGDQIADQPRSGRVVPEYRWDTIGEVFEGDDRIIYRIRSQQVDVLTVRHGAQRLPQNTRSL